MKSAHNLTDRELFATMLFLATGHNVESSMKGESMNDNEVDNKDSRKDRFQMRSGQHVLDIPWLRFS